MKKPVKNTRDYGKFSRQNFRRGGEVGLTDHLPTGPSWWPDEWSTDMHPSKKVLAERRRPKAEPPAAKPLSGRDLQKAIDLAERLARPPPSEGQDQGMGQGRSQGRAKAPPPPPSAPPAEEGGSSSTPVEVTSGVSLEQQE